MMKSVLKYLGIAFALGLVVVGIWSYANMQKQLKHEASARAFIKKEITPLIASRWDVKIMRDIAHPDFFKRTSYKAWQNTSKGYVKKFGMIQKIKRCDGEVLLPKSEQKRMKARYKCTSTFAKANASLHITLSYYKGNWVIEALSLRPSS